MSGELVKTITVRSKDIELLTPLLAAVFDSKKILTDRNIGTEPYMNDAKNIATLAAIARLAISLDPNEANKRGICAAGVREPMTYKEAVAHSKQLYLEDTLRRYKVIPFNPKAPELETILKIEV